MMQKKCNLCGHDSEDRSMCKKCSQTHNERNRLRRKERREAGLCPECGQKAEPNRRMCEPCQTKNRINVRSRISNRRKAGKCAIGSCGNPKLKDHRLCESCAEAARDYNRQRSIELISAGLCTACGQNKHMTGSKNTDKMTKLCQTCHLRQKSAQRLGSKDYSDELLVILERQNWICPYSGDKIVLGYNDSVDHIFPVSTHPDLKFDINNIQWTTHTINMMKSNLLDCEFLSEIEKVAKHLGDDLSSRATSKTHPPQTRESKLYHSLNQPRV